MAQKFFVRLSILAAGLLFAGISAASEFDGTPSMAQATGSWPWIAVLTVLGLLGVVSFVSRRRIHSVVGS
jgi:hypothetical protein